jgi:glutathione peroxidase-family protein
MKELGERWGDQLVILAFPTREFGAQEFQKDEEIQKFAEEKEFPGVLLKLGNVLGPEASQIWQFMKMQTGAADPNWNFKGKFLVSKDGKGML